MVELLFEKCNVPALGSLKSTSAGVFANGRTSALALEMGHSFTSVVPVKDGFTDESKLYRTELAGAVLTEASLELLKRQIKDRSKLDRLTSSQPDSGCQKQELRITQCVTLKADF